MKYLDYARIFFVDFSDKNLTDSNNNKKEQRVPETRLLKRRRVLCSDH